MLLCWLLSLLLSSAAAFSPSGGGPCYHIDGSEDTGSSACYILDSVGATMCCRNHEQCQDDGLCFGQPPGLIGPYDNDTSIWRRSCSDFSWQNGACVAIAPFKSSSAAQLSRCADASFCPRSNDNMNTTCCENHQGTMAGLEQAPIAGSLVSSIRAALLATTLPPLSAVPTQRPSPTSSFPPQSTTSDPVPPTSSASPSSGLSQESIVTLATALPTLFVTALGLVLGSWWKKRQKEKRKSLIQNAQP